MTRSGEIWRIQSIQESLLLLIIKQKQNYLETQQPAETHIQYYNLPWTTKIKNITVDHSDAVTVSL